MTKQNLLTLRWNNLLSLVLGIPLLLYIAVVLSTSELSDQSAFIGMAVIGAVY